MTNKDKYIEFCKQEKNIPIFSKDWWLDFVCGKDNWDVVLFEKGGEIWASWPFYLRGKGIFKIVTMPKLTQTMGIYIKYPEKQKYYTKLSWENEICRSLIAQFPKVDYFNQNFNNSFLNWLPFYWEGYQQTTRYTYIIENLTIKELEEKFESDIRRRIRKASKLGIEVYESNDIDIFYKINSYTFKRKNMAMPYNHNFVKNLYEMCKEHNAVKILFATYKDEIIAASYLIYDENTVYYLMGGINPQKKDLGAMDAIQFASIKFALENNRRYDFEGSMIKSIEKYFRSFGAIQIPYFSISKTSSTIFRAYKGLRSII